MTISRKVDQHYSDLHYPLTRVEVTLNDYLVWVRQISFFWQDVKNRKNLSKVNIMTKLRYVMNRPLRWLVSSARCPEPTTLINFRNKYLFASKRDEGKLLLTCVIHSRKGTATFQRNTNSTCDGCLLTYYQFHNPSKRRPYLMLWMSDQIDIPTTESV